MGTIDMIQPTIISDNIIVPQLEGQNQMADNHKIIFNIPWGHQKILISKSKSVKEALFYAHQTLSNGWSRSVLENQFKQKLYEHLGQLNFYQNLINSTLKGESDNSTIGMLLCRDKDRIEVEYALQNISSPIGVSEFNVKELLPESLKDSFPTVEEVEEELNKIVEE